MPDAPPGREPTAPRARALQDLRDKGYFLVPVPPREKGPREHGWQERTVPYDVPEGWNVGIRTRGELAILITNDADSTKWATRAFDEPHVHSRRGAHWYWRSREGQASEVNRLTPVGLMELHVRNRQALVPPSIHPTGVPYRWGRELPPVGELPECPDIRDLWHPEGTHHEELLKQSAAKAHDGKGAEQIYQELAAWVASHFPDPLSHPERELRSLAESAASKFHRPRPAPRAGGEPAPAPSELPDLVDFPMRTGMELEWTPHMVTLVKRRTHGDERIPVFAGLVRPIRAVTIEDRVYHEVRTSESQEESYATSAQEVVTALAQQGRVLYGGQAPDAMACLLYHMAGPPRPANPTYGVHAGEKGVLTFEIHPVPIRDEQLQVSRQVRESVGTPLTREAVERWVAFSRHYWPEEFLPAFGLALMAPFALELRSRRITVPNFWAYSPEHGLGKSTMLEAVARLFGVAATTGDALNRPFRFESHADSGGIPVCLNEFERVNWDLIAAAWKNLPESRILTRKGNTEGPSGLHMDTYLSRAVLEISSNPPPSQVGSLLTRTLIKRFRPERPTVEGVTARMVRGEVYALDPIGHAVSEFVFTSLGLSPTVDHLEDLINRLEDAVLDAAAKCGLQFQDPRRSAAWAVVLAGLNAWSKACASVGVDAGLPTLEEFVAKTVREVEADTFEGKVTPIDALVSAWMIWRVHNTVRINVLGERGNQHSEEEVRGKGEIWEEGSLLIDNVPVEGLWITEAFLEVLTRDARREHRFGSLANFARTALRERGFPPEAVFQEDGHLRRHQFAKGGRVSAAFLPWQSRTVDLRSWAAGGARATDTAVAPRTYPPHPPPQGPAGGTFPAGEGSPPLEESPAGVRPDAGRTRPSPAGEV